MIQFPGNHVDDPGQTQRDRERDQSEVSRIRILHMLAIDLVTQSSQTLLAGKPANVIFCNVEMSLQFPELGKILSLFQCSELH